MYPKWVYYTILGDSVSTILGHPKMVTNGGFAPLTNPSQGFHAVRAPKPGSPLTPPPGPSGIQRGPHTHTHNPHGRSMAATNAS